MSSVANEVFNIALHSQDIILNFTATAISIQKQGGQGEDEIRDLLEEMIATPPNLSKHFKSLVG
jgi:hypothetical protein